MAFCNSAVTVLQSLLSSACMCCVWQYLLAYTQSAEILFRASYSILQDELFNHMTEQGFKGFQRGERCV